MFGSEPKIILIFLKLSTLINKLQHEAIPCAQSSTAHKSFLPSVH